VEEELTLHQEEWEEMECPGEDKEAADLVVEGSLSYAEVSCSSIEVDGRSLTLR